MRARMQDLTEGAKGLTINEDLEKPEKERVDIFYAKVKANRDAGTLNAKEIVAEAERLEIKTKAPLILAELLFDEKIHVQVRRVFYMKIDDFDVQNKLISHYIYCDMH